MKAVLKIFKNQVRLCLIGKLRHHNGIKNFDSHGHPHGSVQSISILLYTQMATLKTILDVPALEYIRADI